MRREEKALTIAVLAESGAPVLTDDYDAARRAAGIIAARRGLRPSTYPARGAYLYKELSPSQTHILLSRPRRAQVGPSLARVPSLRLPPAQGAVVFVGVDRLPEPLQHQLAAIVEKKPHLSIEVPPSYHIILLAHDISRVAPPLRSKVVTVG